MLWGHSHLLGSGIRGWAAGRKRNLSDRLLGYKRFSAYDLSEEALRRGGDELIRFQPDYVIGYSVALDLFAKANSDRRDALRGAGVKVVVAAAEGFPEPESEARISDLFGCPVAMEYGAVETGLIGHTHPDGGYRAFWQTYLIEAERNGRNAALRVTSLYPRCVPLVRYEIGDEVELCNEGVERAVGITSFTRVIGRCNDFIALSDGFLAHSEVITHAVRSCAAIQSYQVVQKEEHIALLYTAAEDLHPADEQEIRKRLAKVHVDLKQIPFEHVDTLRQTIAGKTPMIIRR
jgi:phenylacetate-coenzyme A ligase PaaK-like adenylate-forming protein